MIVIIIIIMPAAAEDNRDDYFDLGDYDDNSMTMRVNLHDLDLDDQNITDSYLSLQNMIMTLIIEILVIIIIFMIVSSKSS